MGLLLPRKIASIEQLLKCRLSLVSVSSENINCSGNYFVSALLNSFIEKEEVAKFSRRDESSSCHISAALVDSVHQLVISLNFSPVKVTEFIDISHFVKGIPLSVLARWFAYSC